MLSWKLLLGAILGAFLVKESEGANRLYESVRTKIVASVKTLGAQPDQEEMPTSE